MRQARRQAPALLAIVLTVLLGWQSAGLVWRAVGIHLAEQSLPPAADIGRDSEEAIGRVDMSRVAGLHLFGAAEEAAPEVAQDVDAPETRLNLKLRGILSSDEPEYSRAIIASGSSENIYAVGANVPGGATVHAVLRDRVLLNRRGQIEALTLPKQSAEFSIEEDRSSDFTAPADEDLGDIRDQIAEEPSSLSEMVRIRPVVEGGQMRGVRIWPLKDRERFSAAGLQPGDLVTAVNGSPLTDPAAMQDIMQQLESIDSLTLTIERDGRSEDIILNASQ